MPFTPAEIDNIFTYHAPSQEQLTRYQAIRSAARAFAHVLIANTLPSADQTAAIRLLRESVMTANASIALELQPHSTQQSGPPPQPDRNQQSELQRFAVQRVS